MPLANWDGLARQVDLDLAVDLRTIASRVACPTLVIGCARDQIVTQAQALSDIIPGAEYAQIDAGHLAYFEAADEFITLASTFLKRQDA